MFCPKCGDIVENEEKYCNKCGSYLENLQNVSQEITQNISQNTNVSTFNTNNTDINNTNQLNNKLNSNNQYNGINRQVINQNVNFGNNKSNKKQNIIMAVIGLGLGIFVLSIIFVFVILFTKSSYYFSKNIYDDDIENLEETTVSKEDTKKTTQKKGKYSTVIITDNTYSGMKINSEADANKLIVEDSINQKTTTSDEILAIENEIINKYGITAVNLCEMDVEFAKEMLKVFDKIYEEYPSVRGHLTNLSLINASMSEGYIAAFMPVFNFATSDSVSGYPWVIKTQVLLNTTYFLNPTRLEASVKDGSNSGHFPPNATVYSPVAHEFGHYLSFLAMMNNYDVDSILLINNDNINALNDIYSDFVEGAFSLAMIEEAYANYKKDTNTNLTIDEWRATISSYAVTKDNSGNYIYDETIAEAFHDVYLNEENAKDASKYVVEVLKEKLES